MWVLVRGGLFAWKLCWVEFVGLVEERSGNGKFFKRCVDFIMRLHNFSVIVLSYRLFTNLAGDDKMTNLATKPLSRDYGLVARLVILSNMLHKPDLSAARSGTIV